MLTEIPVRLTIFLSVLLIICLPTKSKSTHISGADLTYTWISGNTFELELTMYRDCSGITAPNNVSINYSSQSCGVNNNVNLYKRPGTGKEITQNCSSSSTTCTGGVNPGIQKYEYYANITLPARCTDWVFGYAICCRNCAITTLAFNPPNCSGAPATYIEATLNNLKAPENSSPVFSNLPIAFFCIGQSIIYNHGAFDKDGDSIVYSMVPPRSAAGMNINFIPPYTANAPISSTPPLSISPLGDIEFMPTTLEVGVMAILVQEYRNNILIGSVVRDMQVYTQHCTNVLPTATGVNGTNSYSIVACPGIPLSFTINTADPDLGQSVSIDWNQAIPGATFTSNNSNRPTGTFSWTPSASDARAQPYTFTISVTDDNCPILGSQTYSYSILVPPLKLNLNTTDAICVASATGSMNVIAIGSAPFRYSWSPGNSTTSSINSIAPGVYSVTVTDQFGCTTSMSDTISSPPDLGAALVNSTDVKCYGSNDGSATISVSGGTPPYSYSWIPYGGTSETANNLDSGVYYVSVHDVNNCALSVPVTINQPPRLTLNSSTIPAGCGLSNGSANVSVIGGTQPLRYSWNIGSLNSPTLSNIPSGSYQVTVKDSQDCTLTASIAVSNTTGPVASINSIDHVSCYGGTDGHATVLVSNGTPPFSYRWSNSTATGTSAANLTGGIHSVTVTDSNNCKTAIPFTIVEPDKLLSFATSSPATCYGSNNGRAMVIASGGTPPYNYFWSNGQTDSAITQLHSATYTITTTDAKGCITVSDAVIQQPSPIFLLNISTPASCYQAQDGKAFAQCSGGTPGYTYLWSNGSVSRDNINIGAGTYTVTVTDANGCTETNTTSITQPPALSVVPTITDIICFGAANGSVSVNVSGGTSPYTYIWAGTGLSTSTISNLDTGNYSVSIFDANGCTARQNFQIYQASEIELSVLTSSASCFGQSDGSATIMSTGGTPPYSYQWDNVLSGTTCTQMSPGVHTISIQDQQGCIKTESFIINEPDQVNISVSNHAPICIGQTILLSAQASGGVSPYTYSWQNGVQSQSQSISPAQSGYYAVQVFDANGCASAKDTIEVIVNPGITVSAGTDSICAGESAQLFANASGGDGGPYLYQWSTGSVNQTEIVQPDASSTYTIIVKDNCGSPEASAQFNVIVSARPDATFFPTPVSGCTPLDITFTSRNGNQNIISHRWNFGDGYYSLDPTPSHTFMIPGQYSISHWVMNQNNCNDELTIQQGVTVIASPTAIFSSDPESAPLESPVISFSNQSIDAVHYNWDFGDGTGKSILKNPEYTYRDTGTYIVSLISENSAGCQDTTYGIVKVKGEFAIYIPNAFSPNGDGVNEKFFPLTIGTKSIQMSVYDRWGIEIFQSTEDMPAWDGKDKNKNSYCQMDVYVYIITAYDLEGHVKRYTGRVSLIR